MGFLNRSDGLDGTRYQTRELLGSALTSGSRPGDARRAFEVEVAPGENDPVTFGATVRIVEMAFATGARRLNRMGTR